MAEEKKSIEEKFKDIEKMIEVLEDENTTLAQSLKIYEEGVGLLASCKEELSDVEKQMIVLSSDENVE